MASQQLQPAHGSIVSLPPPPSPQQWKWRCHNCNTKYRLATTRRCLTCSHYFCTSLTSPVMKPKPNPKRPKQLRKRGSNRTCASTFDFAGWARHNSWRRLTLLSSSSSSPIKLEESFATFYPCPLSSSPSLSSPFPSAADAEAEMEKVQWNPIRKLVPRRKVILAKERLYVNKQHNCFLHCDYPSECRHMIFEAYEQGRVTFTQDGEQGGKWVVVDPGPEPEGHDADIVLF
ncbi:hypothetical protein B0T21DRAFT_383729 [Apiosordaria backusii]|uniref:Uncharacterized protein n=1 Tax=Apiosordaria backusii TaxID=314023 RepID=A0AA40EFZ7_9PEZI|nr:hypothetical protein B0T21DRAFT_383729 [Apiosordaria backusii]